GGAALRLRTDGDHGGQHRRHRLSRARGAARRAAAGGSGAPVAAAGGSRARRVHYGGERPRVPAGTARVQPAARRGHGGIGRAVLPVAAGAPPPRGDVVSLLRARGLAVRLGTRAVLAGVELEVDAGSVLLV